MSYPIPPGTRDILPDGRLASASDDQIIRLWDFKSGAEATHFDGHTRGVNALCLLPDGRPCFAPG